MKHFLLLFLLLFSLSAFAGNAVLLTSLELKSKHERYLENKFQKYLKYSGLNLVIHHQVDPVKLLEVIRDEETEAIIWVSHAAKEKEQVPGRSAPAVIMDIHGNDVKNFFSSIPSRIKFLGIVGCQAEEIFNGFRERGHYVTNPDLEIMSFRKKVSMQGGIKKVSKRLAYLLKNPKPETPVMDQEMVEFTLSRTDLDSATTQSSWVEFGDKVLGVFKNDESGPVYGQIPRAIFEKMDNKNIKHNRLHHADQKDESFGRLEISSSEADTWWKLFELRGKPLGGKHQHLYQFRK